MGLVHFEPVLVLGPGRSGTSTVARVLHESMGILMGVRFRDPDETNPRGFFEDLWFRDNNAALVEGRASPRDWRRGFESLLADRRSRGVAWGLKDPRTAHVVDLMAPYVKFSRTVRTRRPRREVIDSCRRCYGWTEREAAALVDQREHYLDTLPPPRVEVDMGARPSDDDIRALLEGITNE